jgi:hypothetical protein
MSPRICKLQINTSGAWRDVAPFNIDSQGDAVMNAAAELASAVGAKLRIASADGLNEAMMHWTERDGWKPARGAA